ncbi:MAG: DUF2169 domain-containing protein [Minicystis sp.]
MSTWWPVDIHPIGLAACGTTLWRFRGQLRVTAVVKATFSFVPGGVMELEEPDDVHAEDIPFTGDPWTPGGPRPAAEGTIDPSRSTWASGDLAPYRLQADVVLVGHAHLPPGGGAVRLVVWSDRAIVDKTIHVADEHGEGAPVPLVYERAVGGPGVPENPAGTDFSSGARFPDLLDPEDPHRPIGFGPIARAWPARAALLGGVDPRVLDERIVEIPSELDWAHFQAAPAGQRIDYLRGDEWIGLEGMSPEHPILQTRLPGATAAGRVYGLSESAVPVAFRADGLHIDADRQRCTMTFRASFSVPGEEVLAGVVLLAGVELPGRTIRWPVSVRVEPPPMFDDETTQVPTVELKKKAEAPAASPPAAPAPSPPDASAAASDAAAPSSRTRQSTVTLDWGAGGPPPMPAPAGRQGTASLAWPEGAPPAPPAGRQGTALLAWPEGSPPAPPAGRQGTALLEWSEGGPPAPSAGRQGTALLEWPDVGPPRAPMRTVAVSWSDSGSPDAPNVLEGTAVWTDDDSPLMGTMAMSDEQQAAAPSSVRAPFRIAAPGSASAPSPDLPGAPWAATRAPWVPAPTAAGETPRGLVLPETMSLPDDLLLEPPPPRPALVTEPPIAIEPAPPAPAAPPVATAPSAPVAPPAAPGYIASMFAIPSSDAPAPAPPAPAAPRPPVPHVGPTKREIPRPSVKASIADRLPGKRR